jgi:aminopeptidase N
MIIHAYYAINLCININPILKQLILFIYLLTSILLLKGNAQLLTNKDKHTRQDTLRGMLNKHRTWWDVNHYDLKIQPDINKFTIKGSNKISFTVVDKPSGTMQIDLQEPLTIYKVLFDNKAISYKNDGNVWYLKIPKHIKKEERHDVIIFFQGVPKPALHPPWDGGIVWKKDKLGNPWIGTACQGLGASSWWPCKDHQSDKPDSATIHITVPDTLMNISNGRLRSVTANSNNTKTWSWHVSNPINTYNLTMNIGKYGHWQDSFDGLNGVLTLDYYVLEKNLDKAKKQFEQTRPMLRAFEYWFGAYPFYEDGYKIVETPYLGMEHQSAIAYGNDFINGYNGKDLSKTGQGLKWDFILVHESGHEWFGNSITTKDVADMWVHEGFTNYSECLYMNAVFDQPSANEYIIGLRGNVQNDKPIIGPYHVNKEGSGDMYYKASNMLHTIRQLSDNDSIFRAMLIAMNTQYRHTTVTTQVIEEFMSTFLGISLNKVFDQYLRTTQIPVLEYKFEKESNSQKIFYRWAYCVDEFDMKIKIPVRKDTASWVHPSREWQSIVVNFPDSVAINQLWDPNFYVEYKQVNQ